MAFCQVKYRDIEGIVHQIDVPADSLFEAVAAAVHQFRKTNWCGHPPGPGCEFSVKLLEKTPDGGYMIVDATGVPPGVASFAPTPPPTQNRNCEAFCKTSGSRKKLSATP